MPSDLIMPVRYSGDVEVRMRYVEAIEVVHVTVRGPGLRASRDVPARRRPSTRDYDRIAALALRDVVRRGARDGPSVRGRRIRLRRVFQAPCPT